LRNKGFTLVELIVVFSVVAIITAVTIPKLVDVLNNAKEETDVNTCDMIRDIMYMCVDNEDVWGDMCMARGGQFRFYLRSNDRGELLIDGLDIDNDTANEIRKYISDLNNPKEADKQSYEVIFQIITYIENGNVTYGIKDIVVSTSDKNFNANAEVPYNYWQMLLLLVKYVKSIFDIVALK